MGPVGDEEGAAGVLGLDCVYSFRVWSVSLWVFHGGDAVLPISPNFLSSKIKKCLFLDILLRPLMVFSEKSSIMSAWVLRTQM